MADPHLVHQDKTEVQGPILAGLLIRRDVRRFLLTWRSHGVTFTEEKGLLDSLFIVTGPAWAMRLIEEKITPLETR